MKLDFYLISEKNSKGTKEYAVIVNGQFPITNYKIACDLQDSLLELVNQATRKKRSKNLRQKQ